MHSGIQITAHIGGNTFTREEVLAWEARRARKVLKKLGAVVPSSADVGGLREAHTQRKLELGHERIEQMLARELRAAAWAGGLTARAARGRRRMCTIDLTGSGASVQGLPDWYRTAIAGSVEEALIGACPDHYISRTRTDGRQEIVETTGGSPLPVRMFFDDDDTSTIRSAPDASFPVEWISVARDESGAAIGGVRHLFRDDDEGFHVRLTVEFPATTAPHMTRAHRWHLACEFSNWIESANRP